MVIFSLPCLKQQCKNDTGLNGNCISPVSVFGGQDKSKEFLCSEAVSVEMIKVSDAQWLLLPRIICKKSGKGGFNLNDLL